MPPDLCLACKNLHTWEEPCPKLGAEFDWSGTFYRCTKDMAIDNIVSYCPEYKEDQ